MNRFFKAVLLTGLFVGTTDLVSAYINQYINSGKFPDKMLNAIAGYAIGFKTALPGNNWISLLGLFFHYFISYSFTLFFFLIFPRVKFLRYDKYLIGMLYGVFVSLFFNYVILPLFPPPRWKLDIGYAYINWVVFGIIFGIPIAYNAYRYYRVTPSSNSSRDWPSQPERIESSPSTRQ